MLYMYIYRYIQKTMTISDLRAIASLIKLNFACFGKSLGRPLYFADRQAATSVYTIYLYVCVCATCSCLVYRSASASACRVLEHFCRVRITQNVIFKWLSEAKLAMARPRPAAGSTHTQTHICRYKQVHTDRHAYGQLQLCNRASVLTCLCATHLVSNVHKTPTICRHV